MSYMHIDNFYKDQSILLFKECYALEKIHGTSAHIGYAPTTDKITYFSGGSSHPEFVALFNESALLDKFRAMALEYPIIVYGEAYGGKLQGMRATYGDHLKFVAFEVKIGDCWLNVPKAEKIVLNLGLEFVDYARIPTDIQAIDAARDAPSTQAIRNCGKMDKIREGIVLRPIEEVILNNGSRLIAKHKRDEFRETASHREVDPGKLTIIKEAKAIAEEWVTPERLRHVLDASDLSLDMTSTGKLIAAMTEDILREAKGEIIDSPSARREIGRQTALLFKRFIRKGLEGNV